MNNEKVNVRSLSLTAADKDYLRELVQWSISTYFEGVRTLDDKSVPKPESPLLQQELGAFVTLKKMDTYAAASEMLSGKAHYISRLPIWRAQQHLKIHVFRKCQKLNLPISQPRYPSWVPSLFAG